MPRALADLPPEKQAELVHIREIVQEELQAKIASSRKARTKRFRILDLIHYTPPCPSRPKHGDKEDALLLIIVSHRALADMSAFWEEVEDRLIRDPVGSQHVHCLIHSASDVRLSSNEVSSLLAEVLRNGVRVTNEPNAENPWRLSPKTLARGWAETVPLHRAREIYRIEKLAAEQYRLIGDQGIDAGLQWHANSAFQLNQAAECAYRMYFLTISGYLPATHQLRRMRHLARTLDNRLEEAWNSQASEDEHYFDLLCRAYIEARYSLTYRTSEQALRWQADRIAKLIEIADTLCLERLSELGADDPVPEVCQPPQTLV